MGQTKGGDVDDAKSRDVDYHLVSHRADLVDTLPGRTDISVHEDATTTTTTTTAHKFSRPLFCYVCLPDSRLGWRTRSSNSQFSPFSCRLRRRSNRETAVISLPVDNSAARSDRRERRQGVTRAEHRNPATRPSCGCAVRLRRTDLCTLLDNEICTVFYMFMFRPKD